MRLVRILVSTVAMYALHGVALAGVIDAPPYSYFFLRICSNYSADNYYLGVGQSFLAEDAAVRAGFYVYNGSVNSKKAKFRYNLYKGDSRLSKKTLVATKAVSVPPGGFEDTRLILADFDGLRVGSVYTLVATTTDVSLPPSGEECDVGVRASEWVGNGPGYQAGQFYMWDYGPYWDSGLWSSSDLAFHVEPLAGR